MKEDTGSFRNGFDVNRQALVKHTDYILKYANDIILLIDEDLSIIEANDRALDSYQYSRDEMIGMKLRSIRADETLFELNENLASVNEKGFNTFETIHKRKDNTTFPIEISSRIVDIEGHQYYQSIGRDITYRKHVEHTLRQSENKFRKIFENSPFSMLMTDCDFLITEANSAFCKMIGYSEEELKKFTFRNFTHPDTIEQDSASLLKLKDGEIPVYKTEKRYIRKDGRIIWGQTTVFANRSEEGKVQFFLTMIEDITASKNSSYELDKTLSLLRAAFESTEDGLLVVSLEGKVLQFNQKFTKMWKVSSELLLTGDDSKVLDHVKNQLKDPDSFLEHVKDLYSKEDEKSFDLLEFRDGRYFERYSQPQLINGVSVGRVWSFRDITLKMKAEKELIAAKEKAEESDRLKTAFLHNVSHEIRTPMNAMIGFSSLLNEPDITEDEKKQYIDIIFQSGGQLLSIINDIVDIANVESGQTRINIKAFRLNMAMRSLCEQFGVSARQKNIIINLDAGLSDEDAVIMSDSTKVIQVLSNLINNAVKFTHKGRIDFGYRLKGEYLEFFVKDTGIGIPAELQSKVFDRFFQVDSAVSRQFNGTGLGLSICKGYVEILGGSINLESKFGEGTCFYFTIPYTKSV